MRYILLVIFCIFSQGVTPSTFEHDGIEREHYLYVPKDADENTPLIIALHGMGGNAKNLRYGIGMTRSAENTGLRLSIHRGFVCLRDRAIGTRGLIDGRRRCRLSERPRDPH